MTEQLGLVRVAWASRTLAAAMATMGVLDGLLLAVVKGGVSVPEHPVAVAVSLACVGAVAVFAGARVGRRAELRGYETAVPLTEPGSVLLGESAAKRPVVRRTGLFAAFLAMVGLAMRFVLEEPRPLIQVSLFGLLAGIFLLRSARTSRWERRHGVVLWQRNVPSQPDPVTGRRPRGMPPLFTTAREAAGVRA
ncbi:hypothetical protein ACIQFZ_42395 [Streptomyces sp. NPDC093064]|uniref:hypothetical protein n=1 Tax=Streptomyces sp. NPDC093064 TaxID=3366020 RepID=UPI0038109EA4